MHHRIRIYCLVIALCTLLAPTHIATATTADLSPSQLKATREGETIAAAEHAIGISALIAQSDLVVRGRVLAVQSYWRSDRRLIESRVTVANTYTLVGEAGRTVTLTTPGGFLAREGIGMVSMHAASFCAGRRSPCSSCSDEALPGR